MKPNVVKEKTSPYQLKTKSRPNAQDPNTPKERIVEEGEKRKEGEGKKRSPQIATPPRKTK